MAAPTAPVPYYCVRGTTPPLDMYTSSQAHYGLPRPAGLGVCFAALPASSPVTPDTPMETSPQPYSFPFQFPQQIQCNPGCAPTCAQRLPYWPQRICVQQQQPKQVQSPTPISFTPTNYHHQKCPGPDNMGTQCLPRLHSDGVYECMYCGVLLMHSYPGRAVYLIPPPFGHSNYTSY